MLALLCLSAPAVAGTTRAVFSGLSDLIAQSEQIVVAMILTEPRSIRSPTFDDTQPQRVLVMHSFKGNLAPNTETTVALRTVLVLGGGDFNAMERYVLFLKADTKGTYRLVGVKGSAFRMCDASDLSQAPAGDARGGIELLLRDAVADAKDRARSFEDTAEEYLSSE
jgi:hypothetical protein